jgi:hypothetical protein
MTPREEGGSRGESEFLRTGSFYSHLRRSHSGCLAGLSPVAIAKLGIDDIRIFRSTVCQLPPTEVAKVIIGVQEVRAYIFRTVLDLSYPGANASQCIDGCMPMSAEMTSQRLKLLQDISSSSSMFPESYWISNVTKGDIISSGAEAIVYIGHHRDRAVAVRQFHIVDASALDDSELDNMVKVRTHSTCIRCKPN